MNFEELFDILRLVNYLEIINEKYDEKSRVFYTSLALSLKKSLQHGDLKFSRDIIKELTPYSKILTKLFSYSFYSNDWDLLIFNITFMIIINQTLMFPFEEIIFSTYSF